jgi:phosphate transport system permease protein
MATITRPPTPAREPRDFAMVTQGQRERPADKLFRYALMASLAVALSFIVILLGFVLLKGWSALSLNLLTNQPSQRNASIAGAQSAILGTLWVMLGTAIFAIPVGIAAAIYLEEYANPIRRINRIIEVNVQNLAAVPSIIYGILGLGLIARGLGFGFTVLTASITLALLILPVIIITSREAIRAVPQEIRSGSLALGASKWQTTWKQVLPSAVPGMATGSILALSRAIGEAAPLLMIGAAGFIRFNPSGFDSAYTTLPIQIYNWIKDPREDFQALAAAAIIVLLAILLIMNSVAIFIRNRYQKKW